METSTMNPIDLIAQARLFLLAAGGVKAAKELANALEFSVDENSIRQKLAPSMLAENILYASTLSYIKETGCSNVLELSCGYSPLGLELVKDGYNYVGADGPEISETMEMTAGESQSCRYTAIDYTNEASLFAAADMLDGPITVVTQGLTSAMSMSEKLLALEGIGKVLAAHGGVWIMPDLDARHLTQGLRSIITGAAPAQNRKWNIDPDALGWQDAKDSIPALNALGFKAEAKALKIDGLGMEAASLFGSAEQSAIDALLKSSSMGYIKAGDTPAHDHSLEIYAALDGTVLNITIVGAIDSNTAPMLLEEYENAEAEGGFTDIAVNCTRLEYISSAGLRALLIMKKNIGDGELRVRGASPVVKEIFENTGFDSLMEVE